MPPKRSILSMSTTSGAINKRKKRLAQRYFSSTNGNGTQHTNDIDVELNNVNSLVVPNYEPIEIIVTNDNVDNGDESNLTSPMEDNGNENDPHELLFHEHEEFNHMNASSSTHFYNEPNVNLINFEGFFEGRSSDDNDPIIEELKRWAIVCNINRTHLDWLLKIIKPKIPSVPLSYKTLLETPRSLPVC